MLAHLLHGDLSELHVVAHLLRLCMLLRAAQHLRREIAQQNLVAALRQSAGDLPQPAAGIQHAQRRRAERRQNRLKLVPEDRLTHDPLGCAVNVLRKFFREIVEVTILHGVGSGMLRSDLCYFVTGS